MIISRNSKITVILLTIAAFALMASTYASITVNSSVNSIGTISTGPNIAVYSDSACTNPVTTLTWGSLSPGGSTTQTVYIKNTGTVSESLSMATSNWSPTNASNYITVTWNNLNGYNLLAGASVAATITLTVSSSISGITNFANTVTFSGTG